MKTMFILFTSLFCFLQSVSAQGRRQWLPRENVPLDSIIMSDPFVLADDATKTYYMTGTGGMLWKSKDLARWSGPYRVVEVDTTSWMGPRPMIWAAEIHKYQGKYYYFATFTNHAVKIDTVMGNVIERRACHVLVSDKAEGPYRPIPGGDATYLPADRPTLDASLWIEPDGKPYMIYCHEWLQNRNGTVECIPLKPDFSGTTGDAKILFRASDSPWSRESTDEEHVRRPNMVTDGPWLFRTKTGRLGMLWTSWIGKTYTQGVAYSQSGRLEGPWIQEQHPITPPNFGHGMMFRTFDGRLLMALNMDVSFNDAGANTILYIPNLLFQSHAKAEQVIWDCIDSIKQGRFSDDIIEGIKMQSYIERQQKIESISKISALLLSLETEGSSYDQWIQDGKRWSTLTREDVMAVANKYFDRDHCTLVRSRMGFPSGEPAVKPDWEHLEPANKDAQSAFARMIAINQPDPIKPQVIDFKKDLDIQPVNPHFNLYSTQNPYNNIFNLEITYNYGIIDNPDINRAIGYMELLGADSLKYQQLQQQLNLLGATFSLVSNEDKSSLTISGPEDNLDSILSLCRHWLYHPRHDARQLEKMLDGLKSTEKSVKNDADSWSKALSEYVLYGDQSQYLRETPYKQWGKRTGEELHAEVLQILTRNGYVTFSGNTDPSTLADKLRHYGLVRDSVTDMRPREFRQKDYTTPQFFYATNKKFLQSNIDVYVPSIYLDTNLFTADGSPCDRAAGSIFTEYFGSGMNSVMFQEIREFRSLGYSTKAYVASSLLRLNPLYTYAYLGTQCDKTQEGVEAIRDLLVTFPERPEKVQPTIKNVVSSRNSNYLTFRRIPEMVQYWKEDLGWHRDFRADLTEQMSHLTIDDLRAFHTKYIKGRPLVVVISGNAKRFDPQAVANLLGPDVKPIKVDFDQMFRF